MRMIAYTLLAQTLLVAAGVASYVAAAGFDRTVHQAMVLGRAAVTVFAPRGKTPESDRKVAGTGRARLATKVFGDWLSMDRLEVVYESVVGAERYVAVYRDPEDGKLKKFTTNVEWLVLGERYPFSSTIRSTEGLLAAVSSGTTVLVDDLSVSDEEVIQ